MRSLFEGGVSHVLDVNIDKSLKDVYLWWFGGLCFSHGHVHVCIFNGTACWMMALKMLYACMLLPLRRCVSGSRVELRALSTAWTPTSGTLPLTSCWMSTTTRPPCMLARPSPRPPCRQSWDCLWTPLAEGQRHPTLRSACHQRCRRSTGGHPGHWQGQV